MDGIFIAKAAAFIGAALAMGIGSIAPAYGQGIVGAKSCENIGKYPESANDIRNAMLIAMGIIETSAIYAFLISLMILWFGS
jgi:F-type H+-transporting ATPase subunit c